MTQLQPEQTTQDRRPLLVSVDVEADGPCPGLYSMVSFGAVVVPYEGDTVGPTYGSGTIAPISPKWVPEALAVSGISRTIQETGRSPFVVMHEFWAWCQNVRNPGGRRMVFVSDNPAFDWQFINYYFHAYKGDNPFGFSARRIGDFYAGLVGDWSKAGHVKNLRKTKHTHNPVDDARGNAEMLMKCFEIERSRIMIDTKSEGSVMSNEEIDYDKWA